MKTKTTLSSSFINQAAVVLVICLFSCLDSFAAGAIRPLRINAMIPSSIQTGQTGRHLAVAAGGPMGIINDYERVKSQRCCGLERFIRISRMIGYSAGIVVVSILVICIRHHLKGLFW